MSILTIDDRDPSIVYSSGWIRGGSTFEFQSTTTGTITAGASAKIPFNGTSIGVYGTIPAASRAKNVVPISTYSIDGGAPVAFTATEEPKVQYRQLFFQSPPLKDGPHVLTISHPLASETVWLDLFMVAQPPAPPPTPPTLPGGPGNTTITTTGTTTTGTSTTATSTTTTSSTVDTTTSSTPLVISTSSTIAAPVTVTVTSISGAETSGLDSSANANTSQTATTKSNTGAIVGGILGGIVALFLIVIAFVIWRRRRRERRNSIISNNFWNTGTTSGPAVPSKPFSLATPPGTPKPSSNVPMMAQAQAPAPSPYGAPRYQGGYTPTPPPNQAQTLQTYPSYGNSLYSTAQEQAYAADAYQDQGYYQPNTYAPPSQILASQASGYGQGAPVPTSNPNYAYDAQNGPRTRVRLD